MKGTKKDHGKFTWLETSLTGSNLSHEIDLVLRRNPTIQFKEKSID